MANKFVQCAHCFNTWFIRLLVYSPVLHMSVATSLICISMYSHNFLCARIAQDERAFTEEEEEKLQHTFGLNHEQLDRVITTCEFFFQQVDPFLCLEM